MGSGGCQHCFVDFSHVIRVLVLKAFLQYIEFQMIVILKKMLSTILIVSLNKLCKTGEILI